MALHNIKTAVPPHQKHLLRAACTRCYVWASEKRIMQPQQTHAPTIEFNFAVPMDVAPSVWSLRLVVVLGMRAKWGSAYWVLLPYSGAGYSFVSCGVGFLLIKVSLVQVAVTTECSFSGLPESAFVKCSMLRCHL